MIFLSSDTSEPPRYRAWDEDFQFIGSGDSPAEAFDQVFNDPAGGALNE